MTVKVKAKEIALPQRCRTKLEEARNSFVIEGKTDGTDG
jgi:hypothetical protein